MPRTTLLQQMAREIVALERDHPVRVAIDGPGAAGKTTLADELVEQIEAHGRPVIRATIDGFHHPRVHRTRRGADSVEGYYHDSFDHHAARENVLLPLGPGGSRVYRKAVFDFRVDAPVDEPHETAHPNAVLLFDGMFLFRPELDDCWDYRIFVHADFHVTLLRARQRDLKLFGCDKEIQRRYHARYIPGQQMYLDQVAPHTRSDVTIDNNDPAIPTATWAE